MAVRKESGDEGGRRISVETVCGETARAAREREGEKEELSMLEEVNDLIRRNEPRHCSSALLQPVNGSCDECPSADWIPHMRYATKSARRSWAN